MSGGIECKVKENEVLPKTPKCHKIYVTIHRFDLTVPGFAHAPPLFMCLWDSEPSSCKHREDWHGDFSFGGNGFIPANPETLSQDHYFFFLGHKILIPQPKVRKTGNQNLTSMFLLGHYFSLSFPTLTLSEVMYIRIEIPCILFLSMMIFQMRKERPVRSDTVNLETLSIGSIERDEMQSHVRECSSSTTVGDA